MNAGTVQKKPGRIYQIQHRFYMDFPDSMTKYFIPKGNLPRLLVSP